MTSSVSQPSYLVIVTVPSALLLVVKSASVWAKAGVFSIVNIAMNANENNMFFFIKESPLRLLPLV
jgi:hypothetical protein